MEDLIIQFSHHVQGKVQLREKLTENKVKMLDFKSDEDFTVKINIQGLTDGEWTASLEWNHDNKPFFIEEHFKIVDKKLIQKKST
ncbi:MAG: hypothetical protein H7098_01860 [Oligoflexus sp.]|nr:hypothetical protein [Pseudopedobacter sp.]